MVDLSNSNTAKNLADAFDGESIAYLPRVNMRQCQLTNPEVEFGIAAWHLYITIDYLTRYLEFFRVLLGDDDVAR